jgi:hypothetical protein
MWVGFRVSRERVRLIQHSGKRNNSWPAGGMHGDCADPYERGSAPLVGGLGMGLDGRGLAGFTILQAKAKSSLPCGRVW